MKMSKRILSSILAILMVVSVCSVGFTANAVDVPSGATLEEVKVEPIARPEVEFTCTPITRVAKAVNSVEPGETIVKSTPSGVPELSGPYAAQAYAGETPVQTTVTFTSTANGIKVTGISCNNETVVLSNINYSNGAYVVTVESGTVPQKEDGTYSPLVFTVDYTWDDGNAYQQKCVSYVESIATGGSYVAAESEIQALSGTGSYYRVYASASTRLLGKGVYYEMPASVETSAGDPYRQYGVYDVSTGTIIENVSVGYNTSLFKDDKTDKPAGKMNQANELSIPGTTLAHVYVDASAATTLADQNIRLDSNVGELSDRNNSNPYTALADAWVSVGSNTDALVTTNDTSAQSAIGLDIPAKADHGVKQFEKNASMTTITGGVGQYKNLFTAPLKGNVANLVDGSAFTVTLKYYAYMWVEKGLLQHYNMTSAATVPVSMTFHIVDKSVLRETLDYVMNTEPDVPTSRAKTKGVNPQAWYYSSGFSAFQTNYVNALDVLNNPKATQTAIDAAATSLNTAYKNLKFNNADYKAVNSLKTEANSYIKNADAYTAESIALLEQAVDGVVTGYTVLYQGAVDTMARNIQTAIDNLELKPADYSRINVAKSDFEKLDESEYVPSTWKAVEDAFAVVVYGKYADEQPTVDAWAEAITTAMGNLVKTADLADWSELNDALVSAKAVKDLDNYVNGYAVADAIEAAEKAIAQNEEKLWTKEKQPVIDALKKALIDSVGALEYKKPDKTALELALRAELPENTTCYDFLLVLEYDALVAQGTEMLNDETLTILDQTRVNKMAENLSAKYEELMASLSHTAGEPKVENEVLPDCTTAGSYDTVIYCTKCGEVISRVPTTVPELGHDYDKKVIEPTCTTAGYTIFTCKVCGYEYIGDDVAELGHTPAAAVIENEVPATVFEEGSYDEVVYCSVCGFEISRNKVTTPKLNHTPAAEVVIENEKFATCTEKGSYDEVLYCACCEEKVELSRETKEVPALGHVNGEAVTENVVEKTCEADGSYDTVIYCTVCKAEVSRVKTTVPTLGHINGDPQEENRVDATCTEKGSYDMVTYCTVCNKVVDTEKFELDIIEHSYTSEVTPPTCTDKGYTTYTCTVCGYEKTGDEVAELGHTPGEWVVTKPAEVGVAGEEKLYCAVCEAEMDSREIPAITAYFRAAEGSTTIIKDGFIYGLEEGLYSLDGFVEYDGGTVEYVETKDGFGTGTVVNFMVNGEVFESYTVVIFGDLTGDGVVDTLDSAKLAQVANYDIELEEGSAVAFAADIAGGDGWVDTLDLAEIYKAANYDIVISQVR